MLCCEFNSLKIPLKFKSLKVTAQIHAKLIWSSDFIKNKYSSVSKFLFQNKLFDEKFYSFLSTTNSLLSVNIFGEKFILCHISWPVLGEKPLFSTDATIFSSLQLVQRLVGISEPMSVASIWYHFVRSLFVLDILYFFMYLFFFIMFFRSCTVFVAFLFFFNWLRSLFRLPDDFRI